MGTVPIVIFRGLHIYPILIHRVMVNWDPGTPPFRFPGYTPAWNNPKLRILYCTVRHSTVLYCCTVHSTVLYCTVLYTVVLYSTAVQYSSTSATVL